MQLCVNSILKFRAGRNCLCTKCDREMNHERMKFGRKKKETSGARWWIETCVYSTCTATVKVLADDLSSSSLLSSGNRILWRLWQWSHNNNNNRIKCCRVKSVASIIDTLTAAVLGKGNKKKISYFNGVFFLPILILIWMKETLWVGNLLAPELIDSIKRRQVGDTIVVPTRKFDYVTQRACVRVWLDARSA